MSTSKKDENKKKILLAAKDCFERYGFKKTTLDDIGKIIGLNKSSIYHYFENKEQIFIEVVMSEFKAFTKELSIIIEEKMPCQQKIFFYFEKKLDFWFQKSLLLSQIADEEVYKFVTFGKETYWKIENKEKAFFRDILNQCIENNQIKDCNVDKITLYMFGLVDGIQNSLKNPDTRFSATPTEHNEVITDVKEALRIFIKGLQ